MKIKTAISIVAFFVMAFGLSMSWNSYSVRSQGGNQQEVTTRTISAKDGGVISAILPGGTRVDLEILRGALSEDEKISIVAKPKRDVPNPGRAAVIFGEYAIDLRPDNLQLNVSCLLTISYPQEAMFPAPEIQEIGVYFFDEGEKLWRPLTVAKKNSEKGEVVVVIDRLAVIAILGTTVRVTALEIKDALKPNTESRLTLYYVAGTSGGEIRVYSEELAVDTGLSAIPGPEERAFPFTAHPVSPAPGLILVRADSTDLYRQRVLIDKPPPVEAADLLKKYAPTLRFSAGENFIPTAIESDFRYGTVRLYRSIPFGFDEVEAEFKRNDSFSGITHVLGRKAATRFYLDFPEPGPIDLPTGGPVVYATATECEDHNLIALQYWFHYYKDDKSDPIQDILAGHEGDFEMVTVFLDRARNPQFAAFSQHRDCIELAQWTDIETEEQTHPVVYVAKGSHASYPRPGRLFEAVFTRYCKEINFPIFDDPHEGDGQKISFRQINPQVLPRLSEVDADSSNAWLLFSGKWGEQNALLSPNTPPFLSDSMRWFDPCEWAGFAATVPVFPTLPNWVPGDGHVHTGISWWDWAFWRSHTPDPRTQLFNLNQGPAVDDQVRTAKKRGLRWVIITDHEEMYKSRADAFVPCPTINTSHSEQQPGIGLAMRIWSEQITEAQAAESRHGLAVILGEELGCVHTPFSSIFGYCGNPGGESQGHCLAYGINSYVTTLPNYSTTTMTNSAARLRIIAHPKASIVDVALTDIFTAVVFGWDKWPSAFSPATGLEVMNNGQPTGVGKPGEDWDSLLQDSIGTTMHPVGIGNSDAHWDGRDGHEDEYPGRSLTYLHIRGSVTHESIYEALEQGRAVASNGPLLVFEIKGKKIGETVEASLGERLVLNIHWVSTVAFGKMKEIDIIRNGKLVETITVNSLSGGISKSYLVSESGYFRLVGRTDKNLEVSLGTDPPYSAYTNPIWVNVSSGVCSIPGLTEREPNDVRGSANSITPNVAGTPEVGVICPEGDVDFFSFNATKDQFFSIRTTARDLNPPSDADTLLTVLDSNGNVLAENDDDGGSFDSLLHFVAPATGRYYIRVRDATDNGGPTYKYELRVILLSSSTSSPEALMEDQLAPRTLRDFTAIPPIWPQSSKLLLSAQDHQHTTNKLWIIHSEFGALKKQADPDQDPRAYRLLRGREPPNWLAISSIQAGKPGSDTA